MRVRKIYHYTKARWAAWAVCIGLVLLGLGKLYVLDLALIDIYVLVRDTERLSITASSSSSNGMAGIHGVSLRSPTPPPPRPPPPVPVIQPGPGVRHTHIWGRVRLSLRTSQLRIFSGGPCRVGSWARYAYIHFCLLLYMSAVCLFMFDVVGFLDVTINRRWSRVVMGNLWKRVNVKFVYNDTCITSTRYCLWCLSYY